MTIIKRNGKEEKYDGGKIISAISKAMAEGSGVDLEIATQIENAVSDKIISSDVKLTVEDINDMVEIELMKQGKYNTAKRFILYRNERSKDRGVINWKRGSYKYLKDEFLEKYMSNPDPFPSELGKFTFYRTYSRPIPEYQRRETWAEVCARVVDFNLSLRPDTVLPQEAEEIYDLMYNLKLFPSGRTLFVGGTKPSKLYSLSNFNCFSRNTEFITSKGIKSFMDFEDGDVVNVLSKTGGWREARVTNFGKAELVKLNLRKGNATKTIEVTKNHRWFVEKPKDKGKFMTKITEELVKGDKLREKKRYETQNIIPCSIGIQHGIVFGDGSYDKFKNHCRVALVGEKQELVKYFTTGSVSTAGSHDQTVVYGLPNTWKELPSIDCNIEYLYGFLIGLFATDGSNNSNNHTISSSNKEAIDKIRDICALVGMKYGETRMCRETSPFTKEYAPLYSINLSSETMKESFLLRTAHKNNYKESEKKTFWKVESIETTGKVEDVWCVEEPDTNTFTLDGNILTYNCSHVTIDKFSKFGDMLYVLMLGVGVGVNLRKEFVNKLPKINTHIELVHQPYKPVNKADRIQITEIKYLNKFSIELIVGDDKYAWKKALDYYFEILTSQNYRDIEYIFISYNNIRPVGEKLKTFGGYSSGYTAMQTMFEKIEKAIVRRANHDSKYNTLKSIDLLDISTSIAENVVSGGVRRSALIVFCDPDDKDVIEAKQELYKNVNGVWLENAEISHRKLSNNTVIYDKKPSFDTLKEQFEKIRYASEPSFGNFENMKKRNPNAKGGNPLSY